MADTNQQPYNAYNFQPLSLDETTTTTTTTTSTSTGFNIKRFLPIIIFVVGILLLIVLLYLIFGRNTSSTTNNTQTDPNQAVTLQWWGVFLDPEIVQPLLDSYKTVKPNVTIQYANRWSDQAYSTAESKYKTDLNTALKTGERVKIPDIFMINNHWVGDYESYLSTASGITMSDFQNQYYPTVVSDFAAGNKIRGLPWWIDTLAVIYNKDMLAAESVSTPPTDWSQFRTLAQKLTKKSGSQIVQAGFAGGTTSNVTYGFELSNILMRQNGVAITDSTGKPIFSQDPDALTGINFLADFQKGSSPTWNATMKNDAAAFLEKDLAMFVAPSYRLREILKYNDEYQIGLKIGVSGLPQLNGQDQPIINYGDYWGNTVYNNGSYSAYAWEFLKWLNEPEQLKALSANVKEERGYFGNLYPRKDMSTENQNDEYLKIYNESLPYIQTWYMVNGTKVKASFIERFKSGSPSQSNISSFENDITAIIASKGKLE